MSKAILVMDMPEICAECEICSNDGICMKANEFCSNRYETKQDWCPLVPLPKPKDHTYTGTGKTGLDLIIECAHDEGYNKCLQDLNGGYL